MVDLTVDGLAIVYRTQRQGREVEVVDLYAIFVG